MYRFLLPVLSLLTAVVPLASGQTPTATTGTAAASSAEVTIPLPEMVSRIEAAEMSRLAVERELEADQQIREIEKLLPKLEAEVLGQAAEAEKRGSTPSFAALMDLEVFWKSSSETISVWQSDLKKRLQTLHEASEKLGAELATWKKTISVPPETQRRIAELTTALQKTLTRVEEEKADTIRIQTRVEPLALKSVSMLAMVRKEMTRGLFHRDKQPIWSAGAWKNPDTPGDPVLAGVYAQWSLLKTYAQRQSDLFTFHGVLVAFLAWGFWHIRRLGETSEALKAVLPRLQYPVAAAVLVSLIALEVCYPQPPRFFWTFWASLGLGTAIYLLRNTLERIYRPFLIAVLGMLVLDEVREVVLNDYLMEWRFFLLAETALGTAFTFWFWKRSAFAQTPARERDFRWQVFHGATGLAFVAFAVATLANALGYVRPAAFLCNTIGETVNHAMILYGIVWLADGYLYVLLARGPVSRLASVAHHRELLWHRGQRLLRWGMTAVLVLVTLQMLEMRHIMWEWLCSVGDTRLSLGNSPNKASLQVKDVVQFVISIGLAVCLSRFIRFLLSEEVYPRVNLPRGIPYAISTMIHYAILFFAFLTSVGDMSKFTVLAGAFGVGLGFGLQNIFNNFVSGLILLFERPIKVGDVVQIGSEIGTVQRIGIRASVIRTETGS